MNRFRLQFTLSFILFAVVLSPLTATGQEPVKLGFAYVFSGRLAHYGFGAKQGAELAIEEVNEAGGILGRKVVGVYADTQLKPEVGVKVARKLIFEDKVDAILGIVSSGVISAVAPVANELGTPLIGTLAMTPDITGKICNPYTFRVSQNGPQNLKGAAILASKTNAKTWSTLGPDYLFGYQCWEYFQKYLGKMRPDVKFMTEDKIAFAPVTTVDFRPYIEKIMAAKPEGVLVSLYGGNLIDFVRQATELGMWRKMPVTILNLAYSADVMLGLGLDMPKGLWLGGLYWFQGNSSPANTKFVKSYTGRYRVFPDYNAQGAYSGVKVYAAACKLAGTTEKHAVIKALEGLTIDLPAGTTTIRKEDHQAVYDGVWGVSSEFDGKLRIRSLKPLRIFSGAEITRPVEETECKMVR
ncbi:MAG: ABC transporter substrate-binding protein [Pseudomonadota bacterium]